MKVVKLCKRKGEQSQEDDPGLPAIELVVPVDYSPNKELDGGFGDEKGVGGEDPAETAVRHPSKETHAWAVARAGIHQLDGFGPSDDCYHQDCLSDHPENELPSAEEQQKLVKIVGRFANGAEDGYEHCSGAYQDCAAERISCEGLSENQGGAYRVEDQSGLPLSAEV